MTEYPFTAQLEKLKALLPIVKAADKPELTALTKFLVDRPKNPDTYVVFLGETSSGKSSIINGMIGQPLLPVSAKPTTGTITEIKFTYESDRIEFYSINKDAQLQNLTKEEFEKQSWQPKDNTARLQITVPSKGKFGKGLRIFDTPGYNSIVDSHEEILKDFLPNCDAVVYTVGYRIGIQNEDFMFLRYLRELISRDIPVIIAVNRCPQGINGSNRRIQEIKKYARDILGFEPQIFTLPQLSSDDEDFIALPNNPEMWDYVNSKLNGTERQDSLRCAFDSFIQELFDKCNQVIKMRLAAATIDVETFERIKESQVEYANDIRNSIPSLIVPAFERIRKNIPSKLNETRQTVYSVVKSHIEESDTLDMETEVDYINAFLLPFSIQKYSHEIVQEYVEVELNDLNKKVDDYIQKEMIRYNDELAIELNSNTDIATQNLIRSVLNKLGSFGLENYAVAFGGVGGANAGIANAASHLLKKTGDLFGKTFSRATHNQLKHFLSKIGATSMKRLGGAIAALTEFIMLAYKANTWKNKACKKVDKSLREWQEETGRNVLKDLFELEKENCSTIIEIAKMYATMFDDEPCRVKDELPKLKADSDLADQWEKMYGYNN